eukprot:3930660-Amphidinium_carterae.1
MDRLSIGRYDTVSHILHMSLPSCGKVLVYDDENPQRTAKRKSTDWFANDDAPQVGIELLEIVPVGTENTSANSNDNSGNSGND